MLNFLQFISEMRHDSVTAYRDWGVIHPKTGKIISGLDHPTASRHDDLINDLVKKKKLPLMRQGNQPEYAHVNFKSGEGHLMLRNVNAGNRAAVHKSFFKLPHHPSKQVELDHQVSGKDKHTKGTALKVYNDNKAALDVEKEKYPWLHKVSRKLNK